MENTNSINTSTANTSKWKPIAIVSIVAFALSTGLAIFFFIQSHNRQSQINPITGVCDNNDDTKTPQQDISSGNTPDISNTGYLAIDDWGIKIKMRDADKVMIGSFVASKENHYPDPDTGAYADSYITYLIKDGALQDTRCSREGQGGTIYRLTNTGNISDYRIVGNHAYTFTAGPGVPCEFNTEDAALITRVFEDFTNLKNIEPIVPFVKE